MHPLGDLRLAAKPGCAPSSLLWSNILAIHQIEINLLLAGQLPMQFVLTSGVADPQLEYVSGV